MHNVTVNKCILINSYYKIIILNVNDLISNLRIVDFAIILSNTLQNIAQETAANDSTFGQLLF